MSKTSDKVIDKMNEGNEKPKTPRKPRAKKKPQGLGDVVENVTEATGIKALVKAVAGDDCGCDERKRILNELFPMNRDVRMNERQKVIWESVIEGALAASSRIDRNTMTAFRQLHEELGLGKLRIGGCSRCARRELNRMRKIYEASCEES